MSDPVFELRRGDGPLVVSIPHDGREVPADILRRFSESARALPDTDWHVVRLYDFVEELGATVLAARMSRYVVDLNRPPDGQPLYAGRWETALVPTHTFAGEPIYASGPDDEPTPEEVRARRERYWQPYHDALTREIDRAVRTHGYALLWDAHSIRSQVPSLFEGRLPDLNIGTARGASCDRGIADAVFAAAQADDPSAVLDGRFEGGAITRRHGRPEAGVHAIQLELVQATYMDEAPPYRFDEARARRIRPTIRRMMEAFADRAAQSR